jgi:hypothetical protein
MPSSTRSCRQEVATGATSERMAPRRASSVPSALARADSDSRRMRPRRSSSQLAPGRLKTRPESGIRSRRLSRCREWAAARMG